MELREAIAQNAAARRIFFILENLRKSSFYSETGASLAIQTSSLLSKYTSGTKAVSRNYLRPFFAWYYIPTYMDKSTRINWLKGNNLMN